MDKVITSSLLIIASVVAAMALINAVMPALGKSSGALLTANSEASKRIKTDIDIIHASGDDSGETVTVWVKNVGTEPISPISSSDVILRTPTTVSRLPYTDGCISDCWDYIIEDSGTSWVQASTVKFTIKTTVDTGAFTVSISVANAAMAVKDFSV